MNDQDQANNSTERSAGSVRSRRRWLAAFALLGVAAIVTVAGVQLFAGKEDEQKRDRALDGSARPVVLERFDLKPRRGKSRRGLAELVRRDDRTYLRIIAAGLRQTIGDQAYQASLTKRSRSKLLGSQRVDEKGVFLGQTVIDSDQLHAFSRIELRLVGGDLSESGRLILRGEIPG